MDSTPNILTSLTIDYDSQLIEDYIQTSQIEVDTSRRSPLAIFKNAKGQSEALMIGKNDGSLYHVYREPLSDSGWNTYSLGVEIWQVAAVSDSAAWAMDSGGGFWQNIGGFWRRVSAALPDAGLVAAGTDGSIWGTENLGFLFRYVDN